MFTIKKTILSIAAVASSVILLSSCGSSEIVNPNLASEIGTAKVSGKFLVNTTELNDKTTTTGSNVGTTVGENYVSTGPVYDAFPAGKLMVYVTYNQSDVNPVPAASGSPAAVLKKSVVATVAADGTYSFDIPASGKGTNITVTFGKFEATYTYVAADNDAVAGNEPTIVENWIYEGNSSSTSAKVYPGEYKLETIVFAKATKL